MRFGYGVSWCGMCRAKIVTPFLRIPTNYEDSKLCFNCKSKREDEVRSNITVRMGNKKEITHYDEIKVGDWYVARFVGTTKARLFLKGEYCDSCFGIPNKAHLYSNEILENYRDFEVVDVEIKVIEK